MITLAQNGVNADKSLHSIISKRLGVKKICTAAFPEQFPPSNNKISCKIGLQKTRTFRHFFADFSSPWQLDHAFAPWAVACFLLRQIFGPLHFISKRQISVFRSIRLPWSLMLGAAVLWAFRIIGAGHWSLCVKLVMFTALAGQHSTSCNWILNTEI